jgi:hypothetical protein
VRVTRIIVGASSYLRGDVSTNIRTYMQQRSAKWHTAALSPGASFSYCKTHAGFEKATSVNYKWFVIYDECLWSILTSRWKIVARALFISTVSPLKIEYERNTYTST